MTIEEEVLRELRPAMNVGNLLYGPAADRNYRFRLEGQAFCEAEADTISGKPNYIELA